MLVRLAVLSTAFRHKKRNFSGAKGDDERD